MLLSAAVFLLAACSGFAAYRLGPGGRRRSPPGVALTRIAAVLAYAWLALSALLFAWAAWRMSR